jgi:hypothetical protein
MFRTRKPVVAAVQLDETAADVLRQASVLVIRFQQQVEISAGLK